MPVLKLHLTVNADKALYYANRVFPVVRIAFLVLIPQIESKIVNED